MALPPSAAHRSRAVRAGDVHRIPRTVVTSSGGTRRLVMTMPLGRARRLGAAASTWPATILGQNVSFAAARPQKTALGSQSCKARARTSKLSESMGRT